MKNCNGTYETGKGRSKKIKNCPFEKIDCQHYRLMGKNRKPMKSETDPCEHFKEKVWFSTT